MWCRVPGSRSRERGANMSDVSRPTPLVAARWWRPRRPARDPGGSRGRAAAL